jgi:hypothetical protein
MENVLFISHKPSRCGIYQFGIRVAKALKESQKYNFLYIECGNEEEYLAAVSVYKPIAIIVNYHPITLPWLKPELRKWPLIGIMHEGYQEIVTKANSYSFDYYIIPDPTVIINNPIVFKTGRLICKYDNKYPEPIIPTIGSFGFSVGGKNFERIILETQKSFDNAIIRLHLPSATFGDYDGVSSHNTAHKCQSLITKPGIKLKIEYDYLDDNQLLDFLAQNSINVFFYDNLPRRGISSVIDDALAVNRPIAITKSSMFRHISMSLIEIEHSTLAEILKRGASPLHQFQEKWTKDKLIYDYESCISNVT